MLNKTECEKIWNLIKDFKVGMFTSVDDQTLRARPMHNVQDQFEGWLWFFTESDAAKVEEAQDEENVCVSYADPANDTYVSLSGKAKLTRDQGPIDKFWNQFASAWFPKGKQDEKVALLEIQIEQAECWDADSNKMVQLYEILKTTLKDEKPDLGENRKYG